MYNKADPSQVDFIVAGQICLDIILMFSKNITDLGSLVIPGKCIVVNNSTMSTGGAVANTGVALHRLGVSTRLISKIGADTFGQSILQTLEQQGAGLTEKMIVSKDEMTSYSIVLNPPGIDRSFLYVPGANYTFEANDVKDEYLHGARFLHFGYPPEMHRIYSDAGKEFRQLMKRIKGLGLTTSLDMAFPDANAESGKVNWQDWLQGGLPFVDIFLPSFDELLFMIDREKYDSLANYKRSPIDLDLLKDLASKVLSLGTAVVVIKLGEQGIYMQTTDDANRLEALGLGKPSNVEEWLGQTIMVPGFKAQMVGTTGAGDCAVAGFLVGISKNLAPKEVLTMAAAVGAFSVEHADASSGVPHWDTVKNRVANGWTTISHD